MLTIFVYYCCYRIRGIQIFLRNINYFVVFLATPTRLYISIPNRFLWSRFTLYGLSLAPFMAYYDTGQVIVRTQVETGGEHFNAALNRMNALKLPIFVCFTKFAHSSQSRYRCDVNG